MKINWGTGIVIAIVSFIGFIMYFVITMTTDQKFNHDLVTEKYYEKELTYQAKIDAAQNAENLGEDILVEKTDKGLMLKFPKYFENDTMKGKVFLYRPSDKTMDVEIPFSTVRNYLLMPDKDLSDGRWNITVEMTHNKKSYLFKKEITY